MRADDLFLGLLCAGAAINLVLFAPAGAIIGAALGKRWTDAAGLGLLFGPIGLGLIPALPARPIRWEDLGPEALVIDKALYGKLSQAKAIAEKEPREWQGKVRRVPQYGESLPPEEPKW